MPSFHKQLRCVECWWSWGWQRAQWSVNQLSAEQVSSSSIFHWWTARSDRPVSRTSINLQPVRVKMEWAQGSEGWRCNIQSDNEPCNLLTTLLPANDSARAQMGDKGAEELPDGWFNSHGLTGVMIRVDICSSWASLVYQRPAAGL